ncbi:MAG: LytTR family DNA-binding domain-containing protein [Pseudomonadota bacterium]
MNGAGAGPTVRGDAAPSSLRLPQWQLLLGWTLGLSVLFAVIGRTDDAQDPLLGVVLFWLLHVGLGLVFCCAATRVLNEVPWLAGRFWLQICSAGLLAALCFAPIALVLEAGFARFGIGLDDLEPMDPAALPRALLSEFGSLAPAFGASWLLLMSVYRQVNSEQIPEAVGDAAPQRAAEQPDSRLAANSDAAPDPAAVEPPPPETAASAGVTALLPEALGLDLWHIVSDLNCLHVRTSRGQAMVLYALARAAEELGDRGLLVHRSHWVAIDAVRQVRRQRQGLVIELLDGTAVPVARRRQAEVRALFGDRFVRTDSTAG